MDDVVRLGKDAAYILDSAAFKKVAEEIQKATFDDFVNGDDEKAMESRRERRAFENVISKLNRLRDRGLEHEKQLKTKELQG